jgi:hypothetical protein
VKATLVHAVVEPGRVRDAARAVEEELIPAFLGRPGARHGYWMVHRDSGRLWILNVWDDRDGVEGSWIREGALRAAVAARLGVRVLAVHLLDVAAAHEEPIDRAPTVRWVRATWVSGLRSDRSGELPALFGEVVPDQARTGGFCASYWLVDARSGAGLGLSFWEGPADVRRSRGGSHRRRERLELVLGCRVDGVHELEALGVAATGDPPPTAPRPASGPVPGPVAVEGIGTGLGTPLDRPPGTLLAVPGERTDQLVIVEEGSAAIVRAGEVGPLPPGAHVGARRIQQRRSHDHAVMTTSPVRLRVLSRTEFATLGRDRPDVVRHLLDEDAEPRPED